MKIDSLVMHSDDIGESVGEFFGSPIREVNLLDVEVREELDMQARARLGLGVETVPAELLPGEVVKDNIIRRETTSEVVGEEFYKAQPQVSFEDSISGLKDRGYYDTDEPRCM